MKLECCWWKELIESSRYFYYAYTTFNTLFSYLSRSSFMASMRVYFSTSSLSCTACSCYTVILRIFFSCANVLGLHWVHILEFVSCSPGHSWSPWPTPTSPSGCPTSSYPQSGWFVAALPSSCWSCHYRTIYTQLLYLHLWISHSSWILMDATSWAWLWCSCSASSFNY